MGTCTRCDSLLHDEHLPPPGTTYNVGDIIALLESVHVPVHDHIFNQEPVPHRRGSTASALSSNSQIRGKLRPAIVLERRLREWQAEHGAEETVVLLFATYEGDFRVRRLLPSILQLFCVAVYPHSEIVEDPDAFHLHTSPEWSNSKKDSTDLHAWLIARQFTSRGQTSDRWKNANRTRQNSHSSFIVDQETRERLLEIIEEKWDQWEALCDEDPSYPKTCRREYQVRWHVNSSILMDRAHILALLPRNSNGGRFHTAEVLLWDSIYSFTKDPFAENLHVVVLTACEDTRNALSIDVTYLSSPIWRGWLFSIPWYSFRSLNILRISQRNSEVAWDPPSAFQNLALHPPESNNKTPVSLYT